MIKNPNSLYIMGAAIGSIIGLGLRQNSKSAKKIDDGKCGCFSPQFILNKNCTLIEKTNPKYDPIKDFEKIDKYIDSLDKEIDIYEITNSLLTKKYGNCLEHDFDNSLYEYLFILQLFDVARVLYLFDNITCEQYKELVFIDFVKYFKDLGNLNPISPYIDEQGIIVSNDSILDSQMVLAFSEEIKLFKSIDWLSKDSSCLAISILINQYLFNEIDIMIYDWSLQNTETSKRFDRYINIVNQAKLQVKQNG